MKAEFSEFGRRVGKRSLLEQSQKYDFASRWRVEGNIEELASILLDTAALPRWWPSAFFQARIVAPGDERSVGRRFDLVTRGWLPYSLRFQMRVTRVDFPHSFTLVSQGDFVGRATGRLSQSGSTAVVHFNWRVRVRKPLLKVLSPILRPLLVSNHYWVMKRGQESVVWEMQRRRVASNPTVDELRSPRLVSLLGFRSKWLDLSRLPVPLALHAPHDARLPT